MDGFVNWNRLGGNICGILSTSVCAGIEYERILSLFNEKWPNSKVENRGTTQHQREEILKSIGKNFVRIDFQKPTTLKNWVFEHSEVDKVYMLALKNHHVVTVKNFVVVDQSEKNFVKRHWCCQKQISRIIEMVD